MQAMLKGTTAQGTQVWGAEAEKREATTVYFVTAVFLVLTVIKVIFHEMWHDETEPWLIARDSNTLSELLVNKQFESHPNLWYFLLYGITRFSHNVYLLQALHVLVATGAVFVFLRKAAFPLLTKVLFVFGYFIFYEYSVLSRIYSLGLLFIFGACALYPHRYKYWIFYCLVLSLAAQVNLFAAMVSGGIVLISFYEYFFLKDKTSEKLSERIFWVGVGILFLGFVYAMLSMVKHPNHGIEFEPDFSRSLVLEKIVYIFHSFLPVAPFDINFWNKNFFDSFRLKVPMSILILVFVYYYLRPGKHLYYVYCFILFAMLSFYFFMYDSGSIRHHGHIFICFIVVAWLANYRHYTSETILNYKFLKSFNKEWTLNIILLVQVIGGLQASYFDLKYTFAPYQEVALFLDQNFEEGSLIVGTREVHNAPITAYSKKFTRIYSYNTSRTTSFFTDENIKHRDDPLPVILENCREMSQKAKKDVIIVSDVKKITEEMDREIKALGVEKVFESTRELIFNYPLTIYKIEYKE